MKKKKVRPGTWRETWYPVLVKEEGERCVVCGQGPPEKYLEVDAKDGNHKHSVRSNVQLMCRSDNRRKNPRGKARRKAPLDSSIIEQPLPSSAEFQKNKQAEPKFRHWLYDMVKKNGRVPLNQAIHSGAEVAGISPVTAKRYLMKLCSEAGAFVIITDTTLDCKVVEFRSAESLGFSPESVDDL